MASRKSSGNIPVAISTLSHGMIIMLTVLCYTYIAVAGKTLFVDSRLCKINQLQLYGTANWEFSDTIILIHCVVPLLESAETVDSMN